jgi:anti-sigma-K factor RskA
MNHLNLQRNDRLRHHLAAEYVLGTLRGRARARFEHWMSVDPGLRATVAEWEARVLPAAELTRAVNPPPSLWSGIERRLGPAPATRSWFDSLGFWRGLGLSASAFAMLLVAVLVVRQPDGGAQTPTYVATLSDEAAQPVFVVSGDARAGTLTVRVAKRPALAADRSLELWAVPKRGAPRSLGLIAAGATVTLRLPAGVTPESAPLLAVSLEPKGGSPNRNAPSGPILFKGAWVAT